MHIGDLLLAYLMLALIALMTSAVSYGVALKVKSEDALAPLMNTVAQPVLLLSGILLPLTFAPGWLQGVADWNPFSWAVDGTRALFAGDLGNDQVWQGLRHHRGARRAGGGLGRPPVRPQRPLRELPLTRGGAPVRACSVRPVPRLTRDKITWLTYAQLGLWGFFLYGFGPVVPLLRDEQGTSAAVAGLHSTGIAAGALLGGAIFPPVARRLGRGHAIWLGLAGVAAGVAALGLLRPLPATIAAVAVIATFGMMVISGVSVVLTARHGDAAPAALTEANAACAGMGILAPLVIGATVDAGLGWRPVMAVEVGLIALVALAARDLPGTPARTRAPAAAGAAASGRRSRVGLPATGPGSPRGVLDRLGADGRHRLDRGVPVAVDRRRAPQPRRAQRGRGVGRGRRHRLRDVRRPAGRRPDRAALAAGAAAAGRAGRLAGRLRPVLGRPGGLARRHRPGRTRSGQRAALPAGDLASPSPSPGRPPTRRRAGRRTRWGWVSGSRRSRWGGWPTASGPHLAFLLLPAFIAAAALLAVRLGRALRAAHPTDDQRPIPIPA